MEQALHKSIELSNRQWKLRFTDRPHKIGRLMVEARNLVVLQERIEWAKWRHGLPETSPVSSCDKAGRDGVWLHRYLESRGIENQVLEPSWIKVDQRRWLGVPRHLPIAQELGPWRCP